MNKPQCLIMKKRILISLPIIILIALFSIQPVEEVKAEFLPPDLWDYENCYCAIEDDYCTLCYYPSEYGCEFPTVTNCQCCFG